MMREELVEYILSLQLRNGGFTSSVLYSKFPKESKYEENHIVFTFSALNSLKMLSAIDRVDKHTILKNLSKYQKLDGSFSSFPSSTECDLRFVYSALSICKLLDDFTHIDTAKAIQYIESCYNFDGGFGLRPKDESHCGAIYCAVASYSHLGLQFPLQKKQKIIHFLAMKQKVCE
jgi:geranylgeranyl transferase type-1 subunit beta